MGMHGQSLPMHAQAVLKALPTLPLASCPSSSHQLVFVLSWLVGDNPSNRALLAEHDIMQLLERAAPAARQEGLESLRRLCAVLSTMTEPSVQGFLQNQLLPQVGQPGCTCWQHGHGHGHASTMYSPPVVLHLLACGCMGMHANGTASMHTWPLARTCFSVGCSTHGQPVTGYCLTWPPQYKPASNHH
jgi:hypothetical protein